MAKKLLEFSSRDATLPLCDIARYGHGSASQLRTQSVSLRFGKALCGTVDPDDKRHGFLPRNEVSVRSYGRPRRILHARIVSRQFDLSADEIEQKSDVFPK